MSKGRSFTVNTTQIAEWFSTYERKSYTALGATIIVMGVFILFAVYPSITEILQSRQEYDQEQVVSSELAQNITALQNLETDYFSNIVPKVDDINEAVPTDPATGPLFANIYKMCQNENMEFTSMTFSTASSDPSTIRTTRSQNAFGRSKLYITLKAMGTQDSARALLLDMENYPRPIDIYGMTLSTSLGDIQGTAKPKFNGIYTVIINARL